MTKTLQLIALRAAFNQAIAIPIALIMAASNGFWMESLIVATTFSQCIGSLCWISGPLVAPVMAKLAGARKARKAMLRFLVFFVDGVAGAEIARRICIWAFGYNMSGAPGLFSLAIGASVAILVGIAVTTVRDLRLNLETRERALREQELTEARLRQAKTDAEMAALQARINPHFLFNTLNSIAALIAEDPTKAEAVTWQLSSLFRYALQANTRGLVSVEEELTIVTRYLDIEQVRLGDRLRYEISVAPELGPHEIPALLLQPLVENAIKHGIAPQVAGGLVRVMGRRELDKAVFTVVDTGGGISGDAGAGVGLENVRRRLDAMYGPDASVSLTRTDGATTTRVVIPLSRPAAAAS